MFLVDAHNAFAFCSERPNVDIFHEEESTNPLSDGAVPVAHGELRV